MIFSVDDLEYLDRCNAAINTGNDAILPWLTDKCPECDQVINVAYDQTHGVYRGWVLIGCEGYHVINPNVLGIDKPNWNDWREGLSDI